ncbi:MAG: radical SAM/SPASM domain-containing protein [Patescibacteria group bacterium]
MYYKNPKSNRENPFNKVYNKKEFKNVLNNKEKPAKFPYLIDIELTNVCNLNCIFCGQQTMKRTKGFLDEKIFKKAINECGKHKTPIRFIRWGEPFLHPKIFEFINYIKNKGLSLHITTNGLAIKEPQIKNLAKAEVDSLIFSFQGATKKQYELMRNNKQYDKLKANILKLVKLRGNKAKPFIHISSTMTNETEKEIKTFIKYWGSIVDSVGTGSTNLSKLSNNQIKKFANIKKFDYLRKQEKIKKCYRSCTEVYQKLSLDWDGKVSCCCGDYDNFMTVGDLNKDTFYDIWNKSWKLKNFRKMLDSSMFKSLTLCSTCFHTYKEF